MRRRSAKYAMFALAYFVSLMGLWVLYTATVSFWELVVGAVAAMLATIGTAVVNEHRFAEFAPDPKWLLYFFLVPVYVARDTFLAFRAAVKYSLKRKSDGYILQVNFDSGGDDARSGARRALVTVLTTIPPNSIVIGIDRHENKMLMHFLAPDEPSWITRKLGARS